MLDYLLFIIYSSGGYVHWIGVCSKKCIRIDYSSEAGGLLTVDRLSNAFALSATAGTPYEKSLDVRYVLLSAIYRFYFEIRWF